MLILLDCRPLWATPANAAKSRFIIACADALARRHDVRWLFLAHKKKIPDLPPGLGDQRLLTPPAMPGWLGWNSWQNGQLVSAAKRYRPDLLLTTDRSSPSRLPCPQRLWVPGIFDQPLPSDTILRTRPFPNPHFQPLSEEERTRVRQTHSDGAEYFLALVCDRDPAGLIVLLKAFSQFKKRQRSNMRLLLAVAGPSPKLAVAVNLENYLYRTSVDLLHVSGDPELARLAGAAYGYIILRDDGFPVIDILNGWSADTPVLTAVHPAGLDADSLLSFDPADPTRLAAHLMRIYTNEAERRAIRQHAAARLPAFDREHSLGELWDGILKAKS